MDQFFPKSHGENILYLQPIIAVWLRVSFSQLPTIDNRASLSDPCSFFRVAFKDFGTFFYPLQSFKGFLCHVSEHCMFPVHCVRKRVCFQKCRDEESQ